jgi:Flp pilus assembly protein TadG
VAALEFAVVAPVFLLFVFGLLELWRMVSVKQAITNAARVGCREATLATTTSTSSVELVVRNQLQSAIHNTGDVAVSVTPSSLSGVESATPLHVHVQVNFSDVSWLPGHLLRFLGDPLIRSESTQIRE